MNGFGSILNDYLEYHKIIQTDFADRLGISKKHMNEIINGNTKLSEDLMIAISLLTDIDINLIFLVEFKKDIHNYLYSKFPSEKEIKEFLNSFYINEMNKRKWLVLKDKSSVVQNSIDLLNFMKVKNFDVYKNYVNKKILFKKRNDANIRKIYLWIRYCDNLIENTSVCEYSSKRLDDLFIDLKKESLKPFNKDRLINLLNSYGIILCIADALTGTRVRGCSMVKGNNPVIYLTTYFKEKSSLYFTLYHELCHIKTNYNKLISKIIIEDDMEKEADEFALNKMIDKKIWNEIMNNLDKKDEICKKNNIPFSFMYSRLAYEKYISYNSKEYNDNIEKINLN